MYTHKQTSRAVALLLSLLLLLGLFAVPGVFAEDLPVPVAAEAADANPEPTADPATPETAAPEQPTPEQSAAPDALPPAPQGVLTQVAMMATAETAMLYGIYAPLSEEIPVIDNDILSSANSVVLINDTDNKQNGYLTISDAMNAIGVDAEMPAGNGYTLVFINGEYTMVAGTDRDAVTNNSGKAASLTVTSTYKKGTEIKTASVKTASNNTTAFDWNFKSTQTLVHHFTFNCTSCSRFLGWGKELTIGSGFKTVDASGNEKPQNIQISVGGSGNVTSDQGSLTIKSGNFNYVYGAGLQTSGSGIYSGTSSITLQDEAYVRNLYVGGNNSKLSDNSHANIRIDNSNGGNVTCNNINLGGLSPAASGLTVAGTLDFTLVGITRSADLDLTKNNLAPATLHTEGATTITGAITAANLQVDDGTLTTTDAVTLTGDLTLAGNTTYERHASGVQNVGGDLKVTGAGAKIKIFKADAAGVPDALPIGGSYSGTDSLTLSFCDKDGNPVTFAHGDQLLTFTTSALAAGGSYTLGDSTPNKVFVLDGKVVVSDKDYPYPTYYEPVDETNYPNLYTFEKLSGSNNTSERQYRKYVKNTTTGVWEVYKADAVGNTSGSCLTEEDRAAEHPLPNPDFPISEYNSCFGAMFRVDGIGAYRIAVAAATNAGSKSDSDDNADTASGDSRRPLTVALPDGKTSTNSSWAVLEQTNPKCTIHKAYLVMTTTLANSTASNVSRTNAELLINHPMRLIADDTGHEEMLSNGYLPSMNVVAVANGATTTVDMDKPTLLYHGSTEGGSTSLGEAMTVTDVTDFVKKHGYGKYYGADIPAYNIDPDGAIAWRLIVIEEDLSMQNLRKVGIQMGPITNQNSREDTPTTIELALDGFTTPDPGVSFEGQLLMIGSDNLKKNNTTGVTTSNLLNSFSPNPEATVPEIIQIGSNDPNTPGVDRPVGSWSQGFMDHNGTRLDETQVEPIRDNGSMGLDLSLLTVTNTQNENWDQGGVGGHNLYLTPQSPAVALYSNRDTSGIGYIDVLGLATEIAIPEFETQITHADVAKPDTLGVDVVAGHTVVINATAKNITTEDTNHVRGTFNTKVVVTVDPLLTNVRGTDGGNTIKATFTDYKKVKEDTGSGLWETKEVTGVYNAADHTITFDFGSDFDYNDQFAALKADAMEKNPSLGEDDFKLFNSRGDEIVVSFLADTKDDPTIDNAEVEYNNSVGVFGHVLYQYERFDKTDNTRYAYDEDDFDTYLHDVTFTKLVTGDLSDPKKEFTFVVTIWDKDGNLLAPDKVIKVIRGKLSSVPSAEVTDPPNAELTVGEGGKVTFTLKHGQTITLQNMPLGSIKVDETGADDYTLSYNMTKQSGSEPATIVTAETTLTGNTTGDTAIPIKEAALTDPVKDYTLNFTNNKESTVPTGVRSKVLPFVLLALALLAGLTLTTTQTVADYKRHKRE